MPVITSSAAWDGPVQKDGSRQVRETHTITGGGVIVFMRSLPATADLDQEAAARVTGLNQQIADEEARTNLDRDGALALNHQTAAQFAVRLREEIRGASRERACYLAWWLLRRIAAGHITDAQCRTAFGLSAAQWTSLKSSALTPRSDAWAAVLAAGEV